MAVSFIYFLFFFLSTAISFLSCCIKLYRNIVNFLKWHKFNIYTKKEEVIIVKFSLPTLLK